MALILDSDHASAIERGGTIGIRLQRRLQAQLTRPAITIVTLEEQLPGWLAQIKRASDIEAEISAYARLLSRFRFFEKWSILPWTREAAEIFHDRRSLRTRIGPMDLCIACIALAHGATLLTRNIADFRQVPGLRVENWLD